MLTFSRRVDPVGRVGRNGDLLVASVHFADFVFFQLKFVPRVFIVLFLGRLLDSESITVDDGALFEYFCHDCADT
jgi:hypothetical protein